MKLLILALFPLFLFGQTFNLIVTGIDEEAGTIVLNDSIELTLPDQTREIKATTGLPFPIVGDEASLFPHYFPADQSVEVEGNLFLYFTSQALTSTIPVFLTSTDSLLTILSCTPQPGTNLFICELSDGVELLSTLFFNTGDRVIFSFTSVGFVLINMSQNLPPFQEGLEIVTGPPFSRALQFSQ